MLWANEEVVFVFCKIPSHIYFSPTSFPEIHPSRAKLIVELVSLNHKVRTTGRMKDATIDNKKQESSKQLFILCFSCTLIPNFQNNFTTLVIQIHFL